MFFIILKIFLVFCEDGMMKSDVVVVLYIELDEFDCFVFGLVVMGLYSDGVLLLIFC